VRVWFGDYVLSDYCVEAALAERYAAASARRFNLRTTVDPIPRPSTRYQPETAAANTERVSNPAEFREQHTTPKPVGDRA
jgi:hypothetical protein